ncbi:hypothetical protein M404DRAFT_9074 [Pisolithus tinctorius Marx 270]|uniref:Uncharacterized protein n=1 Tax=Pisolithus tinctorius Marx 270 TaxID=870435 RepID=A0A0C3K725_PISTI|nr:hypothetical protein M404DRAFT_9074 [Pisolithus tinctorius Marx 270]
MKKKNLPGNWRWYDGVQLRPDVADKDWLESMEGPMIMFDNESKGTLNVCAQQCLTLCECNYAKLQLIARTALSEDLGIGLAGRAMPWALQLVQDLVKELEDLYPIDWAEPMSEAQVNLYTDKQGNTSLHAMDALPMFKNDAKHLWVMEKNAEQAAKDKMRELAEAHRDVKTALSVMSAHAVQVAARKNQRKPKSLELLEDSGDEDTPMEAGPSKTTEDRNAGSSATQGLAEWTLEQAGHGDEDRHVPGWQNGQSIEVPFAKATKPTHGRDSRLSQ